MKRRFDSSCFDRHLNGIYQQPPRAEMQKKKCTFLLTKFLPNFPCHYQVVSVVTLVTVLIAVVTVHAVSESQVCQKMSLG
jgi:hypothetical protein